jgi:hypothetical protein
VECRSDRGPLTFIYAPISGLLTTLLADVYTSLSSSGIQLGTNSLQPCSYHRSLGLVHCVQRLSPSIP